MSSRLPVPAPGAVPGPRAEATGLRDLKGVLMRQRWILLACLALGGTAGATLVVRARPIYEASTLTRVEEARGAQATAPQQLDLALLLGGGAGVGTDLEVLRTRTLATAVVDSLGLRLDVTAPRHAVRSRVLSAVRVDSAAPAGDYLLVRDASGGFAISEAAGGKRIGRVVPGAPLALPGVRAVLDRRAGAYEEIALSVAERDRAVRAVAKGLEVDRPSREANILRLSYQSTDPVLARDVPNVLADRFVALRQEMHTTEARSTARFLREQLDTLSRQLALSEQTLQQFQQASSVVDLETEGRTELTQSAQLQAERSSLAIEHDALAALVRGADADAAVQAADQPSPYRRLAAFPSLMRMQTTSELLSSLTRLENERGALLVRRRPNDPEVEALTSRIRQIEGELRQQADTYRGALAGQIASLDGHLSASRGRLDRIPARALQNARLSRQPQVLSEIYAVLQARLKEAEIASRVEDPSVRIIDPATLPSEPVSPKKKLILGGALMLSLLVALGIGYVREFTDDTVHTPGDLELALGAPTLALVPRLSAREQRRSDRLLPKQSDRAAAALPARAAALAVPSRARAVSPPRGTPAGDAYDWLHTNLLFAAVGQEAKTVMITSAIPGEGKTTTALNLARTMAERGERVLLIDADLRRGRIDAAMGTPGARGLADLVAGTVRIEEVLLEVETEGESLTYLTAGSSSEHPTNLLRSARTRLLVQWAARKFDRVVIDAPPVHAVADAAVLAQHADAVVVIARSGVTPYAALANAAEQLRRVGIPVLGGVMNDVDYDRDARYDASYRWYGYGRDYHASAN
ncbi:MAG TPA: polysaccharide biosynthesis tyrosine autokinase [Longimicrobium sp.]|nr:polysaccharide biosynthesis tyrosine autokinase [Longimicrobium sp.]